MITSDRKIILNSKSYPETTLKAGFPDNCTPDTEAYFLDTATGIVRACKVLEEDNVFANRELVLWQNGKMLPEGFAHAWLKDRLYGGIKNKAKFFIKNTLRSTQTVNEPVLWCIDAYTTGGYYHWITEVLPRLWMVKEYIPRLKFALPDYFLERWPFVQQFLDLLQIDNLLLINDKTKYKIKHLVLPTRAGDPFYRQHEPLVEGVKWIREAALKQSDKSLGKRLYISRAKARYRKVINEDQIIPVLEKYNFRIVYLEDYSLAEQISIYNNAEVLMGIHGAGLTNLVFLPEAAKLIEIRPDKVYNMYNCFYTLAPHFPVSYNFILCDYAPDPLPEDRRIDDHSVIIDPVKLDAELNSILHQ